MKTPLRYPGGKHRATKYIIPFFPKNIETFVSPFFGGGSVEIKLAELGKKVYGYDIFHPLVTFWKVLKNDKEKLIDKCKEIHLKMNKDTFKVYQQKIRTGLITDEIELAAILFCLNRSSFSGTILSGGYSPEHPRFNLSSINRISDVDMTNISVEQSHFADTIKNTDEFLYCDPPYLLKNNNLYGDTGKLHKSFEHKKLNELLTSRNKWILSYNDCEEIREMYRGYEIVSPEWKYGMSVDKKSKEILIINY